jgi:hypothetical protein
MGSGLSRREHRIPARIEEDLRTDDCEPEITLTVGKDVLMVSAHRDAGRRAAKRSELRHGSSERIVRPAAPVRASTVRAQYHDGIVTVATPLADPPSLTNPASSRPAGPDAGRRGRR